MEDKNKQILPRQRLLKGRMLRKDVSVSEKESPESISVILRRSGGMVIEKI